MEFTFDSFSSLLSMGAGGSNPWLSEQERLRDIVLRRLYIYSVSFDVVKECRNLLTSSAAETFLTHLVIRSLTLGAIVDGLLMRFGFGGTTTFCEANPIGMCTSQKK